MDEDIYLPFRAFALRKLGCILWFAIGKPEKGAIWLQKSLGLFGRSVTPNYLPTMKGEEVSALLDELQNGPCFNNHVEGILSQSSRTWIILDDMLGLWSWKVQLEDDSFISLPSGKLEHLRPLK
jgi:hypothetical protein